MVGVGGGARNKTTPGENTGRKMETKAAGDTELS